MAMTSTHSPDAEGRIVQAPNQRARRSAPNADFSAAVAAVGAVNAVIGWPGVEKKSTSMRATAAPLAESLEVVHRQCVAGHVQQRVQQRRAMAGGKHEAVAVGPSGLAGMVAQEALP